MKKIKVKIREQSFHNLKGYNLCDTIYKDVVKIIEEDGLSRAFVNIQSITGKYIGVRVVNYKFQDFFIIKQDSDYLVCMPM